MMKSVEKVVSFPVASSQGRLYIAVNSTEPGSAATYCHRCTPPAPTTSVSGAMKVSFTY